MTPRAIDSSVGRVTLVVRRVAALASLAIPLAMWACDDDDPGFDCGDFTTFDQCREHTECQFLENDATCEGSTGQSGCFTVSCDLCGGSGDNCTDVRGGDGADGCVDAVICPGLD